MTTTASCYCGAIRIDLPTPPTEATSCTCSWCTKAGGLWAYYPPEAVRVTGGAHLGHYAPNGFNEHYFCTRCGCTTHGVSPAWTLESAETHEIPTEKKFAVNVRILDDYELLKSLPVTEVDGRNLW